MSEEAAFVIQQNDLKLLPFRTARVTVLKVVEVFREALKLKFDHSLSKSRFQKVLPRRREMRSAMLTHKVLPECEFVRSQALGWCCWAGGLHWLVDSR